MGLGARWLGDGRCEFVVWAPARDDVRVRIDGLGQPVLLTRDEWGYWRGVAPARPGSRYLFQLDGAVERPDPASREQPDGVHDASAVVDHGAFAWHDRGWQAPPLAEWVFYEIHVGTFTPAGTFDAIVPRLGALRELGVTTLELMPVAAFPGTRNWGYDGVYPFAVQTSYGGPDGLKRLVDACHRHGLALVLDVVYNHFGPEGNYTRDFGPYFTARYRTPWGDALNFDGPGSDDVRRYFFENARQWFVDYHVDGLRLDAVHAISEFSARPFLQELAARTRDLARELDRPLVLIPESNLNDSRLLRPAPGGMGLDAQWADDLHHALHALLTGERSGYYIDFGAPEQLRRALDEGWAYAGEYSAYRQRRHGNSAADLPCDRFVVSLQNHDQIGNRMLGERLCTLIDRERLKLAAGAVLLSPYVPLLFMGEEYGDPAPFLYFVSHTDPELVDAVRQGRAGEFASFGWPGAPPDPVSEATCARSRPHWELRAEKDHASLLAFHSALLRLRREEPALRAVAREDNRTLATGDERVIALLRRSGGDAAIVIMNVSGAGVPIAFPPADGCGGSRASGRAAAERGVWERAFDTRDAEWLGPGAGLPPRARPGDPVVPAPFELALYRKA
jgi:maltooligosyltrehalose trehalohydrolase